jgi:hypothetical protein
MSDNADTPQNSALNKVPFLESHNWQVFNRRAIEYLILSGYDDLLEADDGVPQQEEGESDTSFNKRKRQHKSRMLRACTAIRSRCGTNAYANVENELILNVLLKTLEEKCKNQGTGSLIELILEFWSLRLKEYKSVTEYAEKFRDINKDLKAISITAERSDLDMVVKFIDGLDTSYDIFKSTFLQNRTFIKDAGDETIKVVSFNETVRATLNEEKRIQQADERTAALALVAMPAAQVSSSQTNSNPNVVTVPYCTRCQQRGHDIEGCYTEHPEKAPKGWRGNQGGKKKFKKGYKERRAEKKKAKKGKSEDSDSDEDDNAIVAKLSWMDLEVENIAALSVSTLGDNWLDDTGCSRHCTHKREDFIKFTPLTNAKSIKGIGGVRVQPSGVGIVRVATPGKTLYLSECYYVPELGVNLISPGYLETKGYKVGFGGNRGEGPRNGMWFEVGSQLFTSTKVNNVYILDLDPNKVKEFSTTSATSAVPKKLLSTTTPPPKSTTPPPKSTSPPIPVNKDASSIFNIANNPNIPIEALFALAAYSIAPELVIWHERMGHLGEENLKTLPKVANGVKLYKHHKEKCTCSGCAKGAMRKRPHDKPSKPGKYPMEFILYDLVVVPIKGAREERCFGHIVDQYSKWGDVKSFKSKAEALEYFQEYKAKYERPGMKIRRIRLDNGELKSTAFHELCAKGGIIHEETVPDNPQQNGGSERHGYTIWRKVETILQTAGIPLKHWPQIVETACYLANRSPHSALQGMTPYEKLHGCKPDLDHIRTLGSTAYNLVGGYVKKLQDKSSEGKLIGYDGDSIYKILMPNDKIVRGSNVHIDERIPPGYKPRTSDKRPCPEDDSGESFGKSNFEAVAKRFKFTPSRQPTAEDFTTEDDDDTILRNDAPQSASINQQVPQQPPHSLRTKYYEELVRTSLSHSNLRLPSVSPSPTPTPQLKPMRNEGPGSPDELSLWALVAEANPTEPTEPKTWKEARHGGYWNIWELAAKEEYGSLQDNGTWILVDRPKDRKVLQGKWVWKLKRGSQNQVVRHKARYVIRGDMQQEGLDFYETFASVVKPMSYKAIFAIAAAQDWELEQMDVKTAFLYGNIDAEVYMEQPRGCNDGTGRVCKLQKALYGLKQAPRIWYQTLADYLKTLGFEPLDADMSVFHREDMIIAVYVDDLLIAGPNINSINEVKRLLGEKFHMEDMKACSYYLGMKITRNRANRTIKLSQTGYLEKIIKDFNLWECNTKHDTPMETSSKHMVPETEKQATPEFKRQYQSMVGSLMYAMMGTRPDIAFAVSVVSRFASNPNDYHMKAVKRILRYLRATIDMELTFSGDLTGLTGYSDADWAGDLDTRRSTNGYVFNIGSGTISWSAKRQMAVALSSCESEFMGQTQAIKEAIWLKNFLAQVHSEKYGEPTATVLFCDNQGAMALARNPQYHGRSKHMGIQLNWQREQVEKGKVDLQYTPTERQVADGMTKALPKDRFMIFRRALGVM